MSRGGTTVIAALYIAATGAKFLERAMKDVSRRGFLAASLLCISSVGLLASTGAEAAKATKQQANYRDHPHGGQHCSLCRYFIQPGSCKLVEGPIDPNGWCKFFLPS